MAHIYNIVVSTAGVTRFSKNMGANSKF